MDCILSSFHLHIDSSCEQDVDVASKAGIRCGLAANRTHKNTTEIPPQNRLQRTGLEKHFHTLLNLRNSRFGRAVLANGGRGDDDDDEFPEATNVRGFASRKTKEQPRGSLWRTRSVICKETVNAVHDLKRNKNNPVELSKVFQTKITRLLKPDLLATLAELQRQNEIELALRVFDVVRKEIWYMPDQFLYRAMMDALGRNRRIDELEKKFQELKDEGITPEVPIYRELVGAYVRAHMLPEALEVHAKMVERGCGDDPLSLKFLAIAREKEAARNKQRRKAAEKLKAEEEGQESGSPSEVQSLQEEETGFVQCKSEQEGEESNITSAAQSLQGDEICVVQFKTEEEGQESINPSGVPSPQQVETGSETGCNQSESESISGHA